MGMFVTKRRTEVQVKELKVIDKDGKKLGVSNIKVFYKPVEKGTIYEKEQLLIDPLQRDNIITSGSNYKAIVDSLLKQLGITPEYLYLFYSWIERQSKLGDFGFVVDNRLIMVDNNDIIYG